MKFPNYECGECPVWLAICGDAVSFTDAIDKHCSKCGLYQENPTDLLSTCISKMCERYGEDSQVDVCIEEMSELTKALIKARRSRRYVREAGFDGKADVEEELADVLFMLEYIKHIFDIDEDHLQELVTAKIKRTIERYLQNEG